MTKAEIELLIKTHFERWESKVCKVHNDAIHNVQTILEDGLKEDVAELKRDVKEIKDRPEKAWLKILVTVAAVAVLYFIFGKAF